MFLGALGGFVIPLLAGLLFDLAVVIPLRVPVNETPCMYLGQDWGLGLMLLKVWSRLCVLDVVSESWKPILEQVGPTPTSSGKHMR